MQYIIVFSLLLFQTLGFNLMKPSFIERNKVDISFSQRMSYQFGKEFNMYASEGVLIEEKNIQFVQPGKLVMNVPLVEGVDYAIQFKFESLNANHIICVGIGSQGFILSEVLGIENATLSHFQLGYCSDGTNSTQYPDMYTDFNEFDYLTEDEFDEIDYSYGESQMTNLFGNKEFYMVLRDRQLIFMDNEDSILQIYNDVDRARSFVPLVTMHLRNEIVKKLIKRRECVVKEEYAILLQLVGQFNPFKTEMPPEMKAQREKEKREKETELAKMIREKKLQEDIENGEEQEEPYDEVSEVTDDDMKKEQLEAVKRSEETKKKHEEALNKQQDSGEEQSDQAAMADGSANSEEQQIQNGEDTVEGQQESDQEGEQNKDGQNVDEQKEEDQQNEDGLIDGQTQDEQNENKTQDDSQSDQSEQGQETTTTVQDNKEDSSSNEDLSVENLSNSQSGEESDQQSNDNMDTQPKPEDDKTETHFNIVDIQSHIIYPSLYTRQIVPLRNSVVIESKYTVYQDNQRLAKSLQDYKSCGYAYLDIKPSQNNFFVQIQIDNFDDLYDPYPIGFGVYAYQMLDRLKGWRNSDDQLWCIDKESEDLWQFGALYRTDGTFIDSYMFGEYFKYKVDKKAIRETKINIYFSNKNRVAFTFDDDKTVMLTCVNPKFKYYVPIFETKAYKGVPSVTLLQYVDDITTPFEYSDSIDNLRNAFSKIFNLVSKFIIEKRGSFNEDDDDFTLSGIDDNQKASINMWDIKLYDSQYEWWIKIEDLKQDKNDINVCIGINQMSSEEITTDLFDRQYKAQVAYLCDKNDFIHTFFQECPISSNPILFVPGTVLRFRLSNYLLEVHDGYQFAYFSLRVAGKTGIVPSAIIRSDSKNKITFLKGPTDFGPNPIADRVDFEQLNSENFASYDIFTFPVLEKAKNGLFKPNTNEPLFKKDQVPKPGKKEPPLGKNYQQEEEQQPAEESQKEIPKEEEKSTEITDEEKKLLSSNVPTESHADIHGDTNVKCLIIYEHCDFEGPNKVLYPNRFEEGPPNEFRSFELCRDTKIIEIILQGHVQEKMFVSQSVECLPSPYNVDDIIIM